MDNNTFIKYLKVLGLGIDANKNDIKSAYRSLVKIHHPDLFNNPKNKEKASKNFKIINNAYEYLLNNYIPPKERVIERDVQNNNSEEIIFNNDIKTFLRKCIKLESPVKMLYFDDYRFQDKSEIYIIPLELSINHLIAYSITEKKDKIFIIDRISSVEIYNGDINNLRQGKQQYGNYSEDDSKSETNIDVISNNVGNFLYQPLISVIFLILYILYIIWKHC